MPVSIARSLLPAGSIIGVSCNTTDHVDCAVRDGVDYVGIGAVWGTATKVLTAPVIGVRGVGEMLRKLDDSKVRTVAIGRRIWFCVVYYIFIDRFAGGIKSTNVLRTLHGSVSTTAHTLDGVAVISDIVGSLDPLASARNLFSIIRAFKTSFVSAPNAGIYETGVIYSSESITSSVSHLLGAIKIINPLVHQVIF